MTTERSRTGLCRLWLSGCLSLGVSGALFGCAAGTPRVASDIEAQVPTELHADYVSFATNCSKCHDLDRPLRAHIDDVRHWDLYVAKMMRTAGSAISARESPKILRFLYWYTERKNRLQAERAKEVRPEARETARAPKAATSAPVPNVEAAPREKVDSDAVNPAPPQVNQGEGAP